MALIANTFVSTSAVGNREQLSDTVSNIDPKDTPLMSLMGRGRAKNVTYHFETDSYRTPAVNAQIEGDEYSTKAITPPV